MTSMTAFFDVDHTLLKKSCGELFARYLYKQGTLPFSQVLRIMWWTIEHRANRLDVDTFLERSMQWLAGKEEAWLRDICEASIATLAEPYFYTQGIERMLAHKHAGEAVYLLSAASRQIIEPIVTLFDLDGCLATELDVDKDGLLTGKLIPPFCYGEGKLSRLKTFCKPRGIQLKDCAYYGDSYSDAFVLREVGRPVAANPDRRLRREAKERGWETVWF